MPRIFVEFDWHQFGVNVHTSIRQMFQFIWIQSTRKSSKITVFFSIAIIHDKCAQMTYSFSKDVSGWKVSAAKSLIALLFKNRFVKFPRPLKVYLSKCAKSLAKTMSFWRCCCCWNTPLYNVVSEFCAIFKSTNECKLWNELVLRLEMWFKDKSIACKPTKLCNNKSLIVVNLFRRKFNVSNKVNSANAKSSMYSNSFSDKSRVFSIFVRPKTLASRNFNWLFAKIISSRWCWFSNSRDGKSVRRLPNKLMTVK